MKHGKRFLSFLLVLVLAIGMIPTTGSAEETVSTQNDVSVSGTNDFGNMLSEAISDAQQSQDAGVEAGKEGYGVTALTIEGNLATVTYDAMEEATLLVALYDEENGKLLCSGKTTVTAEDTTATVTIEGTMPPYFEASAFLLDQYDMSPLCPAYSTPMYTSYMQALLSSTAEDYEEDGYEVLKLDEDTGSNFAVYNKSVVVIDYAEGVNVVASADSENAVYVLENCDQQITGLTAGTVIAYPYAEEDILLVKVSAIQVDGTTSTIYGDSLELEEVFDYLKIETGNNGSEVIVDPSTCEEGVTYEGLQEESKPATRAWEDEVTLKKSLVFTLEKEFMTEGDNQVGAKISGTVTMGAEANLSYYISLSRQFVELRMELGIWADVKFSGVLKSTGLTLAEFTLPSPIWGIVFECAPKLVWEFEMSSYMSGKVTAVFGFSYDSDIGWQSLYQKPTHTTQTDMDGKLFMGVQLETSACILDDDIASIGFSVQNGLQISGKMTGTEYEEIRENASKKHTCSKCLAIRFDWVNKASVFMKFIKILKVEYVFLDKTNYLGDMYWSFDPDNAGSGIGKCPHYLYRVTVKVQNRNADPVPDQEVFLSTGESLGKTGKDGKLAAYLEKGNYTFQTTIDGDLLEVEREVTNATRVVLTNNPEVLKKLADAAAELIQSLKIQLHATYPASEGGSGTFSSGVTWNIYRSGIMIIEGDGEMDSYSSNEIPWENLKDKITAVQFKGEIPNVSNYAFAECYNLKTVILADSTVNIGYGAFRSCTALKQIRLPANYQYNSSSFAGCNYVEKIQYGCPEDGIMPDRGYYSSDSYYYSYSLEYIARENLNTVIFEEGIENVADYAFRYSYALRKVFFCSTITEIGYEAFYSSGITEIEFPESLTAIESYAFENSSLTAVEFPESLESIGYGAFRFCYGLTEVVIPDHLAQSIGSIVFQNCTGLKKVTVPADLAINDVFAGCSNIESIRYTIGLTGIMTDRQRSNSNQANYQNISLEYACQDKLKYVTFDEGITRIGNYAFYFAQALETVELPSTLLSIGNEAFYYTGITQIELPEGLTAIESYAFENSNLTAVEFPESLESIGHGAFRFCYGLTEVVIPDHLAQSIGSIAFQSCTGLKKVTVPADLAINDIFNGCSNIESIRYTIGLTGVMTDRQRSNSNQANYQNTSLEYACQKNLKQVTFDEGIIRIGNYAFYFNTALESVALPSTLKSIGYEAFYYTGITQIELPEGLTAIESYAFENSSLTAVEFPESLESIGHGAFRFCYGLTEVVIHDHLAQSIGSIAFQSCTGLKKVTVPADLAINDIFASCSNIESIRYTIGLTGVMTDRQRSNSNQANYQNTSLEYACQKNLKQVTFDEGITRIGNYAFYFAQALESVALPSTLKSIGYEAFYYTGITQIEFPESLTAIESYAFESSKLTAIAFRGNAPTINSTAFRFVTATAYYPAGNSTWTADKLQSYGGTITWEAYTPEQKSGSASGQSSSSSASVTGQEEIKKPATKAVFDGQYSTVEIDGQIVHTAYFENLQPGEEYVMITILDPNAEDLLADSNLLAIMQAPAGDDGTLLFDYIPKENVDTSYVFAAGPSHQDLQDASITFPAMVANGQAQTIEPVVRYNGKVLLEEADYIILGDVDYTEAGEYTCYIRGVREYTGLVTCVYTVAQTGVTAWNVSLGDNIGVNFRVAADSLLTESASVSLTVGDETQTKPLSQAEQDPVTGEYLFHAELAAAQMTEDVLVQITADEQILFEKSYSVAQYAAYILDENNGFDEITIALVTQMLHYGGWAQQYFSYRTDLLANEGIPEGRQDPIVAQVPVSGAAAPNPDGFTLVGMSLVFGDLVSVRFYFTAEDPAEYTLAVNGNTLVPQNKDDMYYVEVTELSPQSWADALTLQVNGDVCAYYSPVNYMVRMYAKTENQALKGLMLAMYRYHLSALAYSQVN